LFFNDVSKPLPSISSVFLIFDFSSFFKKTVRGMSSHFVKNHRKIDAADIRGNLGRIPSVMYSSMKAFRPETN
jgi:hypothetical protein